MNESSLYTLRGCVLTNAALVLLQRVNTYPLPVEFLVKTSVGCSVYACPTSDNHLTFCVKLPPTSNKAVLCVYICVGFLSVLLLTVRLRCF